MGAKCWSRSDFGRERHSWWKHRTVCQMHSWYDPKLLQFGNKPEKVWKMACWTLQKNQVELPKANFTICSYFCIAFFAKKGGAFRVALMKKDPPNIPAITPIQTKKAAAWLSLKPCGGQNKRYSVNISDMGKVNPNPVEYISGFGLVCNGDPYGNRTHVTAVKGPCLNLLTNGPYEYKVSLKQQAPYRPLLQPAQVF